MSVRSAQMPTRPEFSSSAAVIIGSAAFEGGVIGSMVTRTSWCASASPAGKEM
ncbi:MAG TPA: hypothetical protein VGI40_17760 [Pirellulaceae bacterium]